MSDQERAQLTEAWPAWLHGCEKLIESDNWKNTCHASKKLSTPSNTEIIAFLHKHFDVYKAKNEDGSEEGLITGYYQPVLKGSRTKTKKYKIPLYTPPHDLITVDLSEIYPDLKYKRLRGRVEGNLLFFLAQDLILCIDTLFLFNSPCLIKAKPI